MSGFAVLLYLAAAGISGALALVQTREFGRRFFKFHAVLLLAMVVAATAVGRPLFDGRPGGTLDLLVGVIAWVLVLDVLAISMITFSRRPLPSIAYLLPVVTGAFLAVTVGLAAASGRPGPGAMTALHFGTSGALFGSVLVAMNLGHAYLQDASLSFEPLIRMSRLFLVCALAKAAVTLALVAPDASRWLAQILDTFEGMLLLVRVVGGLGGAIALALMTLSCAKARANQSATGILYAAVVVVLVGEGISMYLTLGRGLPA